MRNWTEVAPNSFRRIAEDGGLWKCANIRGRWTLSFNDDAVTDFPSLADAMFIAGQADECRA